MYYTFRAIAQTESIDSCGPENANICYIAKTYDEISKKIIVTGSGKRALMARMYNFQYAHIYASGS